MESYTRAYPYLVKLHMLQELSDAAVLLQEASLAGTLERQRRLRWEERLKVTQASLTVQVADFTCFGVLDCSGNGNINTQKAIYKPHPQGAFLHRALCDRLHRTTIGGHFSF